MGKSYTSEEAQDEKDLEKGMSEGPSMQKLSAASIKDSAAQEIGVKEVEEFAKEYRATLNSLKKDPTNKKLLNTKASLERDIKGKQMALFIGLALGPNPTQDIDLSPAIIIKNIQKSCNFDPEILNSKKGNKTSKKLSDALLSKQIPTAKPVMTQEEYNDVYAELQNLRHIFDGKTKKGDDLTKKEAAAFSNKNLNGLKIDNAKFSRDFANKQGICGFQGSDLIGAKISNSNFVGEALSEANLTNTEVSNTTVEKGNIDSANFTNTTFRNCSFLNVELHECTLDGTKFENCNIQNAGIKKSETMQNIEFKNCKIKDMEMPNPGMAGVKFLKCDTDGINMMLDAEEKIQVIAEDTDFDHLEVHADLSDSVFSNCTMDWSAFHGSKMENVKMENVRGSFVDFSLTKGMDQAEKFACELDDSCVLAAGDDPGFGGQKR